MLTTELLPLPHEAAGGGIARTRDAESREIVHAAAFSADAQYSYDGLNRRVKKDLATGTDVLYIYDGWRCIEERDWDDPWRVGTEDVYSLARHNCRTYSQWEFRDAP